MTTHQHRQEPSLLDRSVELGRHLSAVQTLVAAAKTTFAMALLSAETVIAPVVGALMAFAIYNANNLADREEDSVNRPHTARFVARHSREIAIVTGVAALCAIVLATVAGGPLAGTIVLVPALAGVVYSAPVVPVRGASRLKDVLIANTGLVAAAWAVPIAFLPATLAEDVNLVAAGAVCGYFFLRTFVSVEVFNARDVVGDRESGVSTLPVCLGQATTQKLLLALDAVSIVFTLWASSVVDLSPTAMAAVIPVTLLSMILTLSTTRLGDWNVVCLTRDGEYLVLGVVGLLTL